MRYEIHIRGTGAGLITNNAAAALDKRSELSIAKQEIAAKRGSNRTPADDEMLQQLDCRISLYLDEKGRPTIPEGMIRSCIETAARKLKQGPLVREGLHVESLRFEYDERALGTDELTVGDRARFSAVVKQQQSRILRTRARFETWAVSAIIEVDESIVGQQHLETWLELAGRRVGIGDWRPERSGIHGKFMVESIKALD